MQTLLFAVGVVAGSMFLSAATLAAFTQRLTGGRSLRFLNPPDVAIARISLPPFSS